MWNLLLKCWDHDHAVRPDASMVLEMVSQLYLCWMQVTDPAYFSCKNSPSSQLGSPPWIKRPAIMGFFTLSESSMAALMEVRFDMYFLFLVWRFRLSMISGMRADGALKNNINERSFIHDHKLQKTKLKIKHIEKCSLFEHPWTSE